MRDGYALPTLLDLRDYLSFHGWSEQGPGQAGSVWVNKDGVHIGVPHQLEDDLARGVVERLARTERRPPQEVATGVRYLRYDVTHLRAANDYRITDKIPLETASKIISSARTMLRATATTARWERAQIGSSYSKIGDEVIREAFMGHTEQGSFIIPVLVRIPVAEQTDFHQPTLGDRSHDGDELYTVPPEPYERRVVRTFVQSIQALHDVVVEPGQEPSSEKVHELVYRGVSREFCTALASVLGQSAVGEFETRIQWAPALQAPKTPQRVIIDAEAVDLVKAVAGKLKQQQITPQQIFSGPIVQLRHDSQTHPFGEIGISTVRRGRTTEIRVRLPMEQYRQAWEWHNAGRSVLVEGTIKREPGRPSIVEQPYRCYPLDELFLDSSDT